MLYEDSEKEDGNYYVEARVLGLGSKGLGFRAFRVAGVP